MSAWTPAALRDPSLRASGVAPRLLHATVTPEMLVRQRATNETGLPVLTPSVGVAVRVALDDEALDRKLAALRAHASQTGPQERLVGAAAFREWWREEVFVASAFAKSELSDHRVVQ